MRALAVLSLLVTIALLVDPLLLSLLGLGALVWASHGLRATLRDGEGA